MPPYGPLHHENKFCEIGCFSVPEGTKKFLPHRYVIYVVTRYDGFFGSLGEGSIERASAEAGLEIPCFLTRRLKLRVVTKHFR